MARGKTAFRCRSTATTFVEIMRAAGYDTALIGKCHLQSISGNPPDDRHA